MIKIQRALNGYILTNDDPVETLVFTEDELPDFLYAVAEAVGHTNENYAKDGALVIKKENGRKYVEPSLTPIMNDEATVQRILNN